MISSIIKIKHQFPFFWRLIEKVNGYLVAARYKGLDDIARSVIDETFIEGFLFSVLEFDDIHDIIEMHSRQNTDYIKNFNPHSFDRQTLEDMLENKAYCLMKVTDIVTGNIVGYFFIRCFFVGKAFHGLLTDANFANKGIGTAMWKISLEICKIIGIRMFATVSRDNIASIKSASNATEVKIVKELTNNFLLIECHQKETID